jgi:hypothetical protein
VRELPTITEAPGSRPLKLRTVADLQQLLRVATQSSDGLLGAHCVHELWMRGEMASRIESMLESLWSTCGPSIPEWLPMRHVAWLPQVYEVASRIKASGRGRYNIYLVLLDYDDRRTESYGVYVGMTAYSPSQRFDQHKAGIRAAGSVLKRGLEVLTGPTMHLQAIKRTEAARIEKELAERLADAGLLVQGGR